jgi:hypothetical protein
MSRRVDWRPRRPKSAIFGAAPGAPHRFGLQWPFGGFGKRQLFGFRNARPRGFRYADAHRYLGLGTACKAFDIPWDSCVGAVSSANVCFNQDVGRATDQEKMFNVVTPHDDQFAPVDDGR